MDKKEEDRLREEANLRIDEMVARDGVYTFDVNRLADGAEEASEAIAYIIADHKVNEAIKSGSPTYDINELAKGAKKATEAISYIINNKVCSLKDNLSLVDIIIYYFCQVNGKKVEIEIIRDSGSADKWTWLQWSDENYDKVISICKEFNRLTKSEQDSGKNFLCHTVVERIDKIFKEINRIISDLGITLKKIT